MLFLLKFLLHASIFLLSSVSIFMIITLDSLSDRLLISILFRSYFEFLPCSFAWNIILWLVILSESVCFYVLARLVMSLCLEGGLYVEGVLWDQKYNLVTGTRYFRGIPSVGSMHPPVMAELWLLWACSWVRLAPSMAGYDVWPTIAACW